MKLLSKVVAMCVLLGVFASSASANIDTRSRHRVTHNQRSVYCVTKQTDNFARFINSFARYAKAKGISPRILSLTLKNLRPINYREKWKTAKYHPPLNTFTQYLTASVTARRLSRGEERWQQHAALVEKIARQYQVDPAVIIALWGLETDYGRLQGEYPTIATLATLAYGSKRKQMFRTQLLSALRMIQNGSISHHKMMGSWAGAMGQCQFMPQTYLGYAVDYYHKGKKDIWASIADVMASTANYLHKMGWNPHHGILITVKVPENFNAGARSLYWPRALSTWRQLGLRTASGKALPNSSDRTILVFPTGRQGTAYLVYPDNLRVIRMWNNSTYFGLSVGVLTERLTQHHHRTN